MFADQQDVHEARMRELRSLTTRALRALSNGQFGLAAELRSRRRHVLHAIGVKHPLISSAA